MNDVVSGSNINYNIMHRPADVDGPQILRESTRRSLSNLLSLTSYLYHRALPPIHIYPRIR